MSLSIKNTTKGKLPRLPFVKMADVVLGAEYEGSLVIISSRKSRSEAPLFGRSYTNFIGYLFIHGLLHLKGLDHGTKMENAEKKIRTIFKI